MTTDKLVIGTDDGVVVVLDNYLMEICPGGDAQNIQQKRVAIMKHLDSHPNLPDGFPSPTDFRCKLSSISAIIEHSDDLLEIEAEGKRQEIYFPSEEKAKMLIEHLSSRGQWTTTTSKSGFRFRVSAMTPIILGGVLSFISLVFYFLTGSTSNGPVTRRGAKSLESVVNGLAEILGDQAWLMVSVGILVIAAAATVLFCLPQQTTVHEQTPPGT